GCRGASAPFEPIDAKKVNLIYRHIDIWKESYPKLTIVLIPGCSCGRTSIVIGSNGDVRLCPFQYQALGNINHDSLFNIWRSLKLYASENMAYTQALCSETTRFKGWPQW
ncbi:MAG: SPASM domain-containing protein, partial [Proteobacteria bacterium]|nr:SPASM domain-containing protein [Pseudomonadota bacterium]